MKLKEVISCLQIIGFETNIRMQIRANRVGDSGSA